MLPLWWRHPGESLPLEPSKGRDKSNKAINEILRNFHTIRRRPWALTVALFSFSGGHAPSLNSVLFNIVSSGQKYLLWKFREHSLTAIFCYMWGYVSGREQVSDGSQGDWCHVRDGSSSTRHLSSPTPTSWQGTCHVSRVKECRVARPLLGCFNYLLLTNKICIIYNLNSNIGFPPDVFVAGKQVSSPPPAPRKFEM